MSDDGPFKEPTKEQLAQLAALDQMMADLAFLQTEKVNHELNNAWLKFQPYPKQQLFIKHGASYRERLLNAGNQLGKTYCGAYEMACHLTGMYPDWWEGRRFAKAPTCWAVGKNATVVREVQQRLLCGSPSVESSLGTGLIPKEKFVDKPTRSRGVSDAFDTIQVQHVSGGISTCQFKSYESGREAFQGSTLDVIWCDEEPPEDVYIEILTRTAASKGMVYITFTPMNGRTAMWDRFDSKITPDRVRVTMTLMEVALIPWSHKTVAEAERDIANWPDWQRSARADGTPTFEGGLLFPFTMESVSEPQIPVSAIPPHWRAIWGIDLGIRHPFAAVLMLVDPDSDTYHIHEAFRLSDAMPLIHSEKIRTIAGAVPVAWPHDGNRRETGSGEPVAALYRGQGLMMLPTHATWPEGGYSTDRGIVEMYDRFRTGRMKVASHLGDWWGEFREYHRDEKGNIVKTNDDLMSATRIAVMQARSARIEPIGSVIRNYRQLRNRENGNDARGLDYDLWNPTG